MMECFRLRTAFGTEETGKTYPQIQTMGCTFNANAEASIYNVASHSFPNFTPNLDCFILDSNSNLTDFLSAVQISQGFLISERVKNIITQYNLPEHRFYPAKIKQGNQIHDNYFWLIYIDNVGNLIDYKNTQFFITDSFGDKEIVEINSYINLLKS